MQRYEYKVVPAPNRGEKARGAKTPADRFAVALAKLMNATARDGWDYVRAETLPAEERTGLTRRTTVYHSVLVFRRPLGAPVAEATPRRLLTTEAPAGKAPSITVEAEGAAPRLGAARIEAQPGDQGPTSSASA